MCKTTAPVSLIKRDYLSKMTFSADVIFFCANLAFLAAWAASVRLHNTATPALPYAKTSAWMFDNTFLERGFCATDDGITHWNCAVFDVSMAMIVAVLFCRKASTSTSTLGLEYGMIGYLISHGHGHYVAYSEGNKLEEISDPKEWIILAAVLAIGPASVYQSAKSKFGKNPALIGSILVEIISVLIYGIFLKKVSYSLAYINLSINLAAAGARIACMGPSDVDERMKTFGPYVKLKMIVYFALMSVILIEPTCCDSWFQSIGGHFWFDVILAASSLLEIVSQRELARLAEDNVEKKDQ